MSIITLGRHDRNRVQRNEHSEEVVRQQLKEIDPLLDIKWFPMAFIDEEGTEWEGRYGLICQWAQEDKRWEMYRTGEIGEPFDAIGWFTEPGDDGNMQDGTRLPVDPILLMDRIREWLGKMDQTKDGQDWKSKMRKSVEANIKLRKERQDVIVEETMGEVEYYRKKWANEPIVNLGDGTSESIQHPKKEKRVYEI